MPEQLQMYQVKDGLEVSWKASSCTELYIVSCKRVSGGNNGFSQWVKGNGTRLEVWNHAQTMRWGVFPRKDHELWIFFCSPLAEAKNDQNLELQTVVTCEWGEVQKKSSTCADPEGWNCARLEYFFKTLITWKPRVRHKSDASQNDPNCEGYTTKTPAAALNMQKLIHCGHQSLRRRRHQK